MQGQRHPPLEPSIGACALSYYHDRTKGHLHHPSLSPSNCLQHAFGGEQGRFIGQGSFDEGVMGVPHAGNEALERVRDRVHDAFRIGQDATGVGFGQVRIRGGLGVGLVSPLVLDAVCAPASLLSLPAAACEQEMLLPALTLTLGSM